MLQVYSRSSTAILDREASTLDRKAQAPCQLTRRFLRCQEGGLLTCYALNQARCHLLHLWGSNLWLYSKSVWGLTNCSSNNFQNILNFLYSLHLNYIKIGLLIWVYIQYIQYEILFSYHLLFWQEIWLHNQPSMVQLRLCVMMTDLFLWWPWDVLGVVRGGTESPHFLEQMKKWGDLGADKCLSF